MRIKGAMIVIVVGLSTVSGCGTMYNVAGREVWLLAPVEERPVVPFGGVGNDVRWMERGPEAIVPAAIDMPLSYAGDILTLPWTMYQFLHAAPPTQTVNDKVIDY